MHLKGTHAALFACVLLLSACGSGSDGRSPNDPTPPPGPGDVTISGRITFDRVPFDTTVGQGLNPDAPLSSPARGVVVEAIDAGNNAILATASTDAAGDYTLTAPANRNIFIRAKAQMLKTGAAPTWNFSVRNNTNGDALYALVSASFTTGAATMTRTLHAASGWNGSTYSSNVARTAAPFAILDTVFETMELILSADSTATFPALDLFWSPTNRPAEPLCPDDGNIITSFYVGAGLNDECSTPDEVPSGIYILGDFAQGLGDTDEFDAHVIAHEFGHYFEDQFSRSDSVGGEHIGGQRLDLRLAFGEGWGNAFAAMSLNDPEYRDSQRGVSEDFGFNLESDDKVAEGWFSEASISEILWDIYDPANESGDTVALGFAPMFAVMTGSQISTDAFTSIFSFASTLRNANSGSSAAIRDLLQGEEIFGSDAFGSGETNAGGVQGVLPIYESVSLNTQTPVFCTQSAAGSGDVNKLGNSKFLRLDVPAGGAAVTIQVTGVASAGGQAAQDPDILVFRRGAIVADSLESTAGQETLQQAFLDAGTHIIEIYDYLLDSSSARCMSASITGQ